jgi:hypothetical protein
LSDPPPPPPLSVAAISKIACRTVVIGGPCPLVGTHFFVCVSLCVTNGATPPESECTLLVFLCKKERDVGVILWYREFILCRAVQRGKRVCIKIFKLCNLGAVYYDVYNTKQTRN